MLHVPGLFISNSEGRGRGVFVAHDMAKGDLVEVCPIIEIPNSQVKLVDQTIFHDYYFCYPDQTGLVYIPLGYGAIYNHSSAPNVEIIFDPEKKELEFHTLQNIEAGSELFIDYTGGNKKATTIWFDII